MESIIQILNIVDDVKEKIKDNEYKQLMELLQHLHGYYKDTLDIIDKQSNRIQKLLKMLHNNDVTMNKQKKKIDELETENFKLKAEIEVYKKQLFNQKPEKEKIEEYIKFDFTKLTKKQIKQKLSDFGYKQRYFDKIKKAQILENIEKHKFQLSKQK